MEYKILQGKPKFLADPCDSLQGEYIPSTRILEELLFSLQDFVFQPK